MPAWDRESSYMRIAIELAKRGKGYTEPNPLVGAVVVKNNKIISAGYHKAYGGEHAEKMALKNIRESGTVLYVPLEPCTHFGKTPPCIDLIIQKKVKRVVISMKDPNPLVNGRGIKKLRDNNIQVDLGCLDKVYARVIRHYLTYITRKRPYITLNAAVSLDGKLTDKNRKSQWITSRELRRLSHGLRGEFSAILVGIKTILDDDPQLTLREKGWKGKTLFRIVLDSSNQIDTNKKIFQNQRNSPLIIFSSKDARNRTKKVKNHFFINSDRNGLNLNQVLDILYEKQICSVLVEGGGRVIDSFLSRGLCDELLLFTANKLIGGKESVELFSSGVKISQPLCFTREDILELKTGFIIRGNLSVKK